eukprot:520241_1
MECVDIHNCIQLDQLIELMQQYKNGSMALIDIDSINTLKILNWFLHLLQSHNNNDEEFEYIANLFGSCNICKCTIFHRNCRDKFKITHQQIHVAKSNIRILDKIHCFYMHCYDIGNRLSSVDRKIINQMVEQKHNGDEFVDYMKFHMMKKINETKEKHKCVEVLNNRSIHKFNQLSELKQPIPPNYQYNIYAFGSEIIYGCNDFEYSANIAYENSVIEVEPKYKTIKQELLTNSIQVLLVQQFDNEFETAMLHFQSNYRNANYASMQFEVVLALMIYCNYSQLSYVFSKTYRENTKQHCNYYHLGKYLKMSVHLHGTTVANGKISTFYHGIGEQLLFSDLFGNDGCGVAIYCPLSTSSVLAVAINFTNNNNGLVVQFGSSNTVSKNTIQAKYFSVNW